VTGPIIDPAWQVQDVSLESVVLAYLALSRSEPAAEPTFQPVEVLS
jgi:hypothetical protein